MWEEIITEHKNDHFCSYLRQRINEGDSIPFVEDKLGVLLQPVSRLPESVVPQSMRARLLNAFHYSKSSGHIGGRKLHYLLRRHFYWPMMAMDA